MLTVGSLCSGYEGIGLGLSYARIEHRMVFVADPDKGATAVLDHHLQGVPNLGDIATIDWRTVAPVDLLTAGYPCQPFSTAGKRKGTTDVRHLWPCIADAVRVVRPRYVLLENVAGHRSLGFGRVLADLAGLGYVGSWRSVRASDVGAAHKRERVFILAWREGDDPTGIFDGVPAVRPGRRGGTDPVLSLLPTPRATAGGASPRRDMSDANRGTNLAAAITLLPSPRTSDANGAGTHGDGGLDLRTAVTLLPTPMAADGDRASIAMGRGNPTLVGALLPTPTSQNSHGNTVNGRGELLLPGAVQLLPTPMAADGGAGRGSSSGNGLRNTSREIVQEWGQFALAVARWEAVVGRPAPEPTEPGKNGKPRLSPRFVEWLMGLPAGHVTDLVGRGSALRLCGNGVVPQQLAHALTLLTQVEVPA